MDCISAIISSQPRSTAAQSIHGVKTICPFVFSVWEYGWFESLVIQIPLFGNAKEWLNSERNACSFFQSSQCSDLLLCQSQLDTCRRNVSNHSWYFSASLVPGSIPLRSINCDHICTNVSKKANKITHWHRTWVFPCNMSTSIASETSFAPSLINCCKYVIFSWLFSRKYWIQVFCPSCTL